MPGRPKTKLRQVLEIEAALAPHIIAICKLCPEQYKKKPPPGSDAYDADHDDGCDMWLAWHEARLSASNLSVALVELCEELERRVAETSAGR